MTKFIEEFDQTIGDVARSRAIEGVRSRAMIAGETHGNVPEAEGWWLWLDGSARGCAVFLHDPTGDGLQFDSGATSSETNLAAFDWGGRLVAARGQVEVVESEKLRAALREFTALEEPVGVSCLDSAEYLSATPAGACRRVTETSGGESLTFEDDRRLPAASEADASDLAKLEATVRKILDGNFGAGKILIGGLEVYVADSRYTTAVSGGINVSTSPTSRPGGE